MQCFCSIALCTRIVIEAEFSHAAIIPWFIEIWLGADCQIKVFDRQNIVFVIQSTSACSNEAIYSILRSNRCYRQCKESYSQESLFVHTECINRTKTY